ncbi:MAG: hypothetical protein AB4041_02580, partial [Microcystaceae cyanobacterium]
MTTYEQETWGWKLQNMIQQLQEWWELQARNLFSHSPALPNIALPNPSRLQLILQYILLIIAIFLIAWGILRIVDLIKSYHLSQSSTRYQPQPSAPQLSAQEWLKRSQQFQQQEDYYQACRSLYLAMLHHLQDQNLLMMEKSRTDQEYNYLIISNL